MQFEAVHTTGIYCRAECSARPHPKNVESFPNAIAAEAAGFRPCLRCRPERLPDSIDRTGPPVIEQAVAAAEEMAGRVESRAGDTEPSFSVSVLENQFRDGESPVRSPHAEKGELFKNAPAVKGDYFKVATIIE